MKRDQKVFVLAVMICAMMLAANAASAAESVPAKAAKAAAAAAPSAGPAGKGDAMKKMSQKEQKQTNDLMSMFNEKLKHRFAPVIKKLTIGSASVGKPISISLEAAYDSKEAMDKIKEASVYYTIEGSGRMNGPVKLQPAGANVFKGAIPPIARAGKLFIMPVVKDSYGNVGVDLSCPVNSAEWPPFEDPCMPPGAVAAGPVDDPAALIEDDFDVWDFRIGMDDKYIYLMTEVEGEISKGTMNPTHVNTYLSLLVDTQELNNIKDITVFMSPEAKDKFKDKADMAKMVFYAPLAPSIDPNFKSCFIPKFGEAAKAQEAAQQPGAKGAAAPMAPKGGAPAAAAPGKTPGGQGAAQQKQDLSKFIDTKSVKCKADGSNLYIKIDKATFPERMRKSLSVIGMVNGFITNMQMPLPTLREMLPVTRVTWNPHVAQVR